MLLRPLNTLPIDLLALRIIAAEPLRLRIPLAVGDPLRLENRMGITTTGWDSSLLMIKERPAREPLKT